MSDIREIIRNEMEAREMMGLDNLLLDTKRFIDPHTGKVPQLIADIYRNINISSSSSIHSFPSWL